MTAVASWWAYVIRHEARETWRAMPGPWWCKALLIAVCVAVPGPQDEIALALVVAAFRKRQASKIKTSNDDKTSAAAITVELSRYLSLPAQTRREGTYRIPLDTCSIFI